MYGNPVAMIAIYFRLLCYQFSAGVLDIYNGHIIPVPGTTTLRPNVDSLVLTNYSFKN